MEPGGSDRETRDRGEGRDAPDFGELDVETGGRTGYTNKAEIGLGQPPGLGTMTPYGEPVGSYSTNSSPQGLLGLFGQWGPFAGNTYGTMRNVSLANVLGDVLGLGRVASGVLAGPLAGAVALGTNVRGFMNRNPGALPSPGGVGGQSFDPSAGAAAPSGPRDAGPRERYRDEGQGDLYRDPFLQELLSGRGTYAARIFPGERPRLA